MILKQWNTLDVFPAEMKTSYASTLDISSYLFVLSTLPTFRKSCSRLEVASSGYRYYQTDLSIRKYVFFLIGEGDIVIGEKEKVKKVEIILMKLCKSRFPVDEP